MSHWTLDEAVATCRVMEQVVPAFGYHVALTGGTLYKDGPRKDCDILLYRIRQVEAPNRDGVLEALTHAGLRIDKDCGWCVKASIAGKDIDLFFPDHDGEYPV